MSGNDDMPLLSAAEKISSGVPVDWNEVRARSPRQSGLSCRRTAVARTVRSD